MQLFVGSYGHRYSDPCGRFVGFTKESVEQAVESGMEWEVNELPTYCEHPLTGKSDRQLCDEDCTMCAGSTCALCHPDIVSYGVWEVYSVRELGGLRETIELIKECNNSPIGVSSMEY